MLLISMLPEPGEGGDRRDVEIPQNPAIYLTGKDAEGLQRYLRNRGRTEWIKNGIVTGLAAIVVGLAALPLGLAKCDSNNCSPAGLEQLVSNTPSQTLPIFCGEPRYTLSFHDYMQLGKDAERTDRYEDAIRDYTQALNLAQGTDNNYENGFAALFALANVNFRWGNDILKSDSLVSPSNQDVQTVSGYSNNLLSEALLYATKAACFADRNDNPADAERARKLHDTAYDLIRQILTKPHQVNWAVQPGLEQKPDGK